MAGDTKTGQRMRIARREGIARGVLEGKRLWTVVGAVAWAVHGIRWATRREEPVVHSEVLRPGEQLVVSHYAPEPRTRRQRRKAERKATRKATGKATKRRS